MFRPDSNRDRTDYSGILMPPDGYRLDRAVGTTYSLDLEALTAVAIRCYSPENRYVLHASASGQIGNGTIHRKSYGVFRMSSGGFY